MLTDITIVGSGIACTITLTELLSRLLDNQPEEPLRITVVEKHAEFWKGIPYGSRSSVNGLTITSIYDFFTADEERILFFEWLDANKTWLFSNYERLGGAVAERWLTDNQSAIDTGKWENVYLPRFMVGEYFHDKLIRLYQLIKHDNLAGLDLISGEVIAVNPLDGNYEVVVEKELTPIKIASRKVVVAIGSAPERKLTSAFDNQNQVTYINNVYEPGTDSNVKLVQSVLRRQSQGSRHIMIVGSNAACIELLYVLNNAPAVRETIDQITLLSTGGTLPYHITYQQSGGEICHHLEALKRQDTYSFDQLIEAAAKDIRNTPEGAICIPYVDKVISETLNLLKPMDDDTKKQFYGIHGVQLARLFRRSGTDYKRASDALMGSGQLKLLKGRYIDAVEQDNAGVIHYQEIDSGKTMQSEPFKVLVNCTGSDDLTQSSSRLIRNLIEHNGCRVNLSGKAFEVNERLEAAPNLYVIGPLIGGNYNKRLYFWHLENASRIRYLAPYLVTELLRKD